MKFNSFSTALIVLPFLGGAVARAGVSAANQSPTFYFGFGGISENMSKYSTDPAADSTSLTATLYFNLLASAWFPVMDSVFFAPAIGYTPLGVKSPEEGEASHLLTAQLRAAYAFDPVDVWIGPGLIHKIITASGGTTVLNNGTSTSTFAFPPDSKSMNMLDWDVGVGLDMDPIRIDLDFMITGTFSSRRAVDGMGTVSYGLF